MKLSRKHVNAYTRSTVTLVAALACTSTFADEPAYTMTVISDAAYGAKVAAGEYDTAIAKITAKSRATTRYSELTNLCVAYTKSGDLENASAACGAAVEQMRAKLPSRGSAFTYMSNDVRDRKYLALALSNQGVLHAVSGEPELARESFLEALELKASVKAPKVNLARLEKDI